jgi:hypothetical protein
MLRRRALWTAAGIASAAVLLAGPQLAPAMAGPSSPAAAQLSIYSVPGASDATAQRLIRDGFDVLEKRTGENLYVLGDAATAAKLRADGFSPKLSENIKPANWKPPTSRLTAAAAKSAPLADPVDETYFGGYHTVKAQFAHLDKVATAYPTLARVVDYGDSWLKSRNAATGYDLKAICLTHKTADYECKLYPGAPKPRFLLMTQIHAREIVTGDISWRWIDYLTQNYGKVQAVTDLLNTTEIWVVPVANPDGVDVVQQGGNNPYLQRKNVDGGTGCPLPPGASGQRGVDLNRNTSSHFGGAGTSTNPCSEVFRGANGNSEPENAQLETMFKQIWPDQRGPNDTDAAPVTARGVMLSLHSYAGVVLYPWGWDNKDTANAASLAKIGGHIGQLTGYGSGQPGEVLYNASGNIEDWTYGELGVASFTVEMDSCNSFTPSYSCAGGQFTKLLPSLMYLGQQAKAPYTP